MSVYGGEDVGNLGSYDVEFGDEYSGRGSDRLLLLIPMFPCPCISLPVRDLLNNGPAECYCGLH